MEQCRGIAQWLATNTCPYGTSDYLCVLCRFIACKSRFPSRRSAPRTQTDCRINSTAPNIRPGGCADKTQNIIDISANSSDISTNTSDILENIIDILSLVRTAGEFVAQGN